MMVLALGASFVACGSDDDDDDDGLLGTWVGKDGSITLTLKIERGGTGSWTTYGVESYSGHTSKKTGTFTYKMEGKSKGIVTVKYYDSYYGYETDIFYFVIEGKKMYVYEDGYGDDLEFVLTKK